MSLRAAPTESPDPDVNPDQVCPHEFYRPHLRTDPKKFARREEIQRQRAEARAKAQAAAEQQQPCAEENPDEETPDEEKAKEAATAALPALLMGAVTAGADAEDPEECEEVRGEDEVQPYIPQPCGCDARNPDCNHNQSPANLLPVRVKPAGPPSENDDEEPEPEPSTSLSLSHDESVVEGVLKNLLGRGRPKIDPQPKPTEPTKPVRPAQNSVKGNKIYSSGHWYPFKFRFPAAKRADQKLLPRFMRNTHEIISVLVLRPAAGLSISPMALKSYEKIYVFAVKSVPDNISSYVVVPMMEGNQRAIICLETKDIFDREIYDYFSSLDREDYQLRPELTEANAIINLVITRATAIQAAREKMPPTNKAEIVFWMPDAPVTYGASASTSVVLAHGESVVEQLFAAYERVGVHQQLMSVS